MMCNAEVDRWTTTEGRLIGWIRFSLGRYDSKNQRQTYVCQSESLQAMILADREWDDVPTDQLQLVELEERRDRHGHPFYIAKPVVNWAIHDELNQLISLTRKLTGYEDRLRDREEAVLGREDAAESAHESARRKMRRIQLMEVLLKEVASQLEHDLAARGQVYIAAGIHMDVDKITEATLEELEEMVARDQEASEAC